jgi:hypothetical protein
MSRYTVAVTDIRFEDLSIEREGLADLADVRVLAEDRVPVVSIAPLDRLVGTGARARRDGEGAAFVHVAPGFDVDRDADRRIPT